MTRTLALLFAVLSALCVPATASARTIYFLDDAVFEGAVTGIEVTNTIQISGAYTTFSSNTWDILTTSNYIGTLPSYAGYAWTLTNSSESLTPPGGVEVWVKPNGGAWTSATTNVPVEVAIVGELSSPYFVHSIEVYSYVNPDAANSLTDARLQTILVDTPQSDDPDDMISTKAYTDAADANDSSWSSFPVTTLVDLASKPMVLSDTWELSSADENSAVLAFGGQPVITASAGMVTGLAITNWSVTTNNPPSLSLTVSNGVNQWPVQFQWCTNIAAPRWNTLTNTVTWTTNGSSVTGTWTVSRSDPSTLIRAVQSTGVTRLSLGSGTEFFSASGAVVVGDDLRVTGEADLRATISNSSGNVEVGDALDVSGWIGTTSGIEFDGVGGGGPTITFGSAAPSSSQPNGSLYLRTDGSLYLRTNAAWVIK